jgi:hypothetical protein
MMDIEHSKLHGSAAIVTSIDHDAQEGNWIIEKIVSSNHTFICLLLNTEVDFICGTPNNN